MAPDEDAATIGIRHEKPRSIAIDGVGLANRLGSLHVFVTVEKGSEIRLPEYDIRLLKVGSGYRVPDKHPAVPLIAGKEPRPVRKSKLGRLEPCHLPGKCLGVWLVPERVRPLG